VRLSDSCCKLLIIEVFTERGVATASESRFSIPTLIRRSNPRWEELENSQALRLRSENWDVSDAAIGSSVPRRGYHRDLSLSYYRIPHLDGWFSRSSPQ